MRVLPRVPEHSERRHPGLPPDQAVGRSGSQAARRLPRIGLRIAAALAVALSLALTGCDGGSENPPPNGPLAEALADVSGGTEHGSLGIGWAEPRLVEESGAGAELIADALGPNAGTVIDAAPVLRRRFGLDPLSADRLVSVGGSPIYRAAADCLGDAVAARMIPDTHLLSTDLGVDLVAIGAERRRELLCVLGGTPERAEEVAIALESSLVPDAREPDSGEPMADIVAAVDVETAPYEGVEVVRAELTPAAGRPPGFLFGAVSRGSLAEMITSS